MNKNYRMLAALSVAAISASANGQVLGDSLADFSGVQGQANWQYGYWRTTTPGTFVQLPFFGTISFPNGLAADNFWGLAQVSPNFLVVHEVGQHPSPVEDAVRRFVVPTLPDRGGVAVAVSWGPVGGAGPGSGNGVRVSVQVNGASAWSRDLPRGGSATTDIQIGAQSGDVLDFVTNALGNDVFDSTPIAVVLQFVPACSPADLAAPFASLTFADITAFLTAFSTQDPIADLAEPIGQFTFADITAFLAAFSAGCP